MLAITGGSELSHICLIGTRRRRELQRYSPHQYRVGGVDDMILGGGRGGRERREFYTGDAQAHVKHVNSATAKKHLLS